MVDMWVMKPGEEERGHGLEAEGARLQKELADIAALSDEEACRLCGTRGALTEEHAPSKSAGNKGRMIRAMIDHAASMAGGSVVWKGQVIQGAKYESLCASCNNQTGSWYNPAYVRFARGSRHAAVPAKAGTACRLDVAYRARIIKQALTSLLATSQPGVTSRYPALRELLLGREEKRAISPVRVWLYLMANGDALSTGITIRINTETRQGHMAAGFAFWPLGWLMTFGDVVVPGAIDVTVWTELDYHDRAPVLVDIPCQWALTAYPGDFRGPRELPGDPWEMFRSR